jgi:hypothetical protein
MTFDGSACGSPAKRQLLGHNPSNAFGPYVPVASQQHPDENHPFRSFAASAARQGA